MSQPQFQRCRGAPPQEPRLVIWYLRRAEEAVFVPCRAAPGPAATPTGEAKVRPHRFQRFALVALEVQGGRDDGYRGASHRESGVLWGQSDVEKRIEEPPRKGYQHQVVSVRGLWGRYARWCVCVCVCVCVRSGEVEHC